MEPIAYAKVVVPKPKPIVRSADVELLELLALLAVLELVEFAEPGCDEEPDALEL